MIPRAFDSALQDLRLAWVGLRRAKAFTGAAVLTLAVGISGSTVMFALVQGVLLRPLPVPKQDRLVVVRKALPAAGAAHWPFRAREVDVLARESRVLESVAGLSYYDHPSPFAVVENGAAGEIKAAAVTGDFFRVLGVSPILGRALSRADDVPGAENVLVLTHALWQRRYGGATDVIGRRLLLGEQPFVVAGVMPRNVECPHGVEAWMTLAASASTQTNAAFREGVLRDVDLIARLPPGATLAQAEGEIHRLAPALDADAPPDAVRGWVPVAHRYADLVTGDVRQSLLLLFAAVGLVLLIASANAANLLLVRGEGRRTELAVRAALGAGPGRLVRQLLAESVLLSLAAGLVGLGVTWWTLQTLLGLVPGGLPRMESVRLDGGVLAFTLLVSFSTAALAGLSPALSVARTDLVAHLRLGGRGGSGSRGRSARRGLVVGQVALALALVAAASLLTRSLLRLQGVDMGLAADRLVFVRLDLPDAKYADAARHSQLLEDLLARLAHTPGIAGATPVHTPPFAGTGGWDAPEFTAEGQSLERVAHNPSLNLESIHPTYFVTVGVMLVRGRAFTAADGKGSPEVAVVSEDVAHRTWPGVDPLGKRLKLGGPGSTDPWRTVVGVARPTRYRELIRPRPTLYVPAAQFVSAAQMLVLRTTAPLDQIAGALRGHLHALDPDAQATQVVPFRNLLHAPLAQPRFNALLIGVFGVAALLLTAIGLYGVLAATVRQRQREMGVRLALGARAADLRRLVVGEGLRLACLGAALGLAGTLLATRLLRGLLFEVQPLDPASLLLAVLLLVGLSVVACAVPAHRATRVDPVALLRAE